MKYLAAYSLLVLAGNAAPCKFFSPTYALIADSDVEKLLKEVGVQSNKDEVQTLITAIGKKKLHDLVNDGSKRLASVPSGGVAVAAPAGAPAQAQAAAGAPAAKKEEKPKEEEADVDMGGLFGDDY